MGKEKEKKILSKEGWVSNFVLTGEVNLYDNTFKINQHSEKSDWIYNQMFLNIYCGEYSGRVSCECSGGYGLNRDNVIYCVGKDEDGKSNFKDKITVDWNDRFDANILKDIGNSSFKVAGIEKDEKGKVFVKRFLSDYDFIKYLSENLTNGMIVTVRGNIKYTVFNGDIQVRKEVNSIYLHTMKENEEYSAKFTQTFLIGKDSCSEISSDGVMNVDAIILEYFKEYNGNPVIIPGSDKKGGNVPLHKQMELKFNVDDSNERMKKMRDMLVKKYLSSKKGYTEVRWDGCFVESGASVKLTEDDLDDEVKFMIAMGLKTLDEALQTTATSGGRVQKMVLKCPSMTTIDVNGVKRNVIIEPIENKYTDDDLALDCLMSKEAEEAEGTDNTNSDEMDDEFMNYLSNMMG